MFVIIMDLIAMFVIAKCLIEFVNVPQWGAVILAVPAGIVVMRFFYTMFMILCNFLLTVVEKDKK